MYDDLRTSDRVMTPVTRSLRRAHEHAASSASTSAAAMVAASASATPTPEADTAGAPSSAAAEAPDLRRSVSAVSSTSFATTGSVSMPPEKHCLSTPVLRWVRGEGVTRKRPSGWGSFQRSTMEGITFADLKVRLGAHYLYCHQGDCEHILVFTDARCVVG